MNIRFFFVKDRVDKKEIRIEYCPTEKMRADYFTKPLQGKLFYIHRDDIMNIDPSSPYHSGHRSVLGTSESALKVRDNEQPGPELVEADEMKKGLSYRDALVSGSSKAVKAVK